LIGKYFDEIIQDTGSRAVLEVQEKVSLLEWFANEFKILAVLLNL